MKIKLTDVSVDDQDKARALYGKTAVLTSYFVNRNKNRCISC